MVMENFAKQMIDFQRTTFDNSFNAAVMLQDQAEQMFNSAIAQADWMPVEGKQMVDEWVRIYKTGRDGFKDAVDDNFDKLSKYCTNFEMFTTIWETEAPKTAKPTKPVKPVKAAN